MRVQQKALALLLQNSTPFERPEQGVKTLTKSKREEEDQQELPGFANLGAPSATVHDLRAKSTATKPTKALPPKLYTLETAPKRD